MLLVMSPPKPETEIDLTVTLWHATSSSREAGPVERLCETWLEDSERARADQFRQPTSRNQHVIGRGMARRLLCEQVVAPEPVPPNAIRFETETFGKPFVVAPQHAKRPFNVAHTDGLVMCGLICGTITIDDALVGVDVERLNRRTDPGLADRYFSKPEVDYVRSHRGEDDRRSAFLRVWTLKESFIKAIGTGLQTPLADFAFQDIDSPTPTIEMLSPKLQTNRIWQFRCFTPRPGFIAAAAVSSERAIRPTFEVCDFDRLLSPHRANRRDFS
jgi:4'-phosphopantetheinyl transferase